MICLGTTLFIANWKRFADEIPTAETLRLRRRSSSRGSLVEKVYSSGESLFVGTENFCRGRILRMEVYQEYFFIAAEKSFATTTEKFVTQKKSFATTTEKFIHREWKKFVRNIHRGREKFYDGESLLLWFDNFSSLSLPFSFVPERKSRRTKELEAGEVWKHFLFVPQSERNHFLFVKFKVLARTI